MGFFKHHAKLSQPCYVVNTLHKVPQPCDNLKLVTDLQDCGKVATIYWYINNYKLSQIQSMYITALPEGHFSNSHNESVVIK